MLKRRFLAIALSASMMLTVVLSACGGKEEAKATPTSTAQPTEQAAEPTPKPDPFGKFDPPVEVTACRILTSWMGFDEGENENNNWWTKTYLEKLGVKVNVVWTAPNWGEPLEQKIATSIATDDLPDLIPVYGSIVQKLLQAEKTGDIKQAYEDYASDEVKALMNRNNGQPYKNSFYNGKMFGLAHPGSDLGASMIWIRKDWLDKYQLSEPKNFADLENIAKTFIEKQAGGKGTYGIAMDKDIALMSYLYPAFGAYPSSWVEKNGKLEYSLVQPEVKEALKQASAWYQAKLISNEFATKDQNNELNSDIASGKVGIVFSGSHFPNGGGARALKKNNPEAEWIFVPMMTPNGDKIKHFAQSKSGDFIVVSKNAKHPEAIIRMVNLHTAIFGPNKPDYIQGNEFDTTPKGNMNFWNSIITFGFGYPGKNWMAAQTAREELKKGGDGSGLKVFDRPLFEQLYKWKTEGTKAENYEVNWAMWKLFGEGGSEEYINEVLAKDINANYNFDKFTGLDTPGMGKYGGEWNTKHKEFFINAIMNGKVDEQFDAWVKYFYNNGGEQVTKEVNEWYQNNK